MARAIQLAKKGLYTTEPNPRVGCVIVKDNKIVGEGWHEKAGEGHAEINALKQAGKNAEGATVYVTLEPCAMCAGAIVLARIDKLVFAAQDEKTGAAASLYNIPQDRRLNHYVEIVQGVEESHSAEILEAFFRDLRSKRIV